MKIITNTRNKAKNTNFFKPMIGSETRNKLQIWLMMKIEKPNNCNVNRFINCME